jgi:Ankyrin repeat
MASVYRQWRGVWGEIDRGNVTAVAAKAADMSEPGALDVQVRLRTPLFLAVQRKNSRMVELLLALGADPNIQYSPRVC